MADKVFSFEEVANHNKNGDCWLIINAKVYDVSLFMEEHPGGHEVMLNVTGKDATPDFDDIGHSSYAEGRMKEFYIGNFDESTVPEITAHPTAFAIVNKDSNDSSSKFLLYALPLLILGVAYLLRFYSKNEKV